MPISAYQLRPGELEAAAAPVERALALATDDVVLLLAARMEAPAGDSMKRSSGCVAPSISIPTVSAPGSPSPTNCNA